MRESQAKPAGSATLTYQNKQFELPVFSGTTGPNVVDIRKLYTEADIFTYDPGFTSTASCESDITFIDGDKGILLYRGYSIDQLAGQEADGRFRSRDHHAHHGARPDVHLLSRLPP